MPWAEVNGTQLYYEVHGSGPPMLLAHGGGANHVSWWQQLSAFTQEYTVVTYDQRGFGLSGANDQSTVALVDDLEGLVEFLGYDRVILLGQSLGGYAVAGFASRHPERVAALIITSSPAGLVPVEQPAGAAPAAAAALPTYLDLRASMIRRGKFPERNPMLCLLVEELAAFNHRVDVHVLVGITQVPHDIEPLLGSRMPILLLANEEDLSVTEAMRRLHTMLPGAEFVVIPDADHLSYIEQPETYNAHVLDFCHSRAPAENHAD